MDIKPLIGLAGVLIAVMGSDLNDQLTGVALVDIRGALGVSYDAGTWLDSVYTSAQPLGMAISAWFMVTFSLRPWAMFVIALIGLTSLLIPFSPNEECLLTLRALQGLAGGLMTPLLMSTALMVLPPPIRLYGLAVYALTATFTPYTVTAVAALWVDVLRTHYVFYQALPMSALGAALVWYGLPVAAPHYERFRLFDWRAFILIAIGFGALTTMLSQGDRLNWFDSQLICLLALASAVAIPLLVLNEWYHPLPFLKLQMLGRRNFAYGALGLFCFIIISSAAGPVPNQFLVEVQGFRPEQALWVTLEIALAQLVMLPLMAVVLDKRHVDSRLVTLGGLALMTVACVGSSYVTIYWDDAQFYLWQGLQAVGQPMVVMALLMMATNTVKSEKEAPFASAMINFPRSVAEVVAVWVLDLVKRWRGSLHYDRLADQVGQHRWDVVQGHGVLPQYPAPLLADGQPRAPGSLSDFADAVHRQADILTVSDAYLVMAALTAVFFMIVLALPVRTLPPRLVFAKH